MTRQFVWRALQTAALGMLLPAPGLGQEAQSSPLGRSVTIEAAELTLADAIAQVRRQAGVSIVVDGEARRDAGRVSAHGTARQALDAVAAAFDLGWVLDRTGIVLMRSRYNRGPAEERPQFQLAEWRAVARDLLEVLRLAPSAGTDPLFYTRGLTALADALTSAQREVLKGGGALRAADLTPPQADLLQRAIWARAFGEPRAQVDRLAALLRLATGAVLRVQREEGSDAARHWRCVLVLGAGSGAPATVVGRFTDGRNDAPSEGTVR